MVPIIAGVISLIPQLVTTISSVVKDKKEKKEAETAAPKTGGEAILNAVKEMASGDISSKRVLNIAGTGIIIMHGITTNNPYVICIGAVYSLGMSFITYLSERNNTPK